MKKILLLFILLGLIITLIGCGNPDTSSEVYKIKILNQQSDDFIIAEENPQLQQLQSNISIKMDKDKTNIHLELVKENNGIQNPLKGYWTSENENSYFQNDGLTSDNYLVINNYGSQYIKVKAGDIIKSMNFKVAPLN